MLRLGNVALSGWIAWTYGVPLGLSLFGWGYFWIGAAIAFLVPFTLLNLVIDNLAGGIWNSGLWTASPMRRLVGAFADGVIYLLIAFMLLKLNGMFGISQTINDFVRGMIGNRHPEDTGRELFFVWLVLLVWLLNFVQWLAPRLKYLIGTASAPFRNLIRSRFVGMGGSSRFGGLFDDWAHPHRPGQLMLGSSLYSPGWKIGRSDDRHFITIATSRSGKGRSAIIPNLLAWPGSALVIDPKGQNAAVTAAARGQGGGRVKKGMGQTVRIVDPFGELKAAGVDLPVHRFNPLAELNLSDVDLVEQIESITEALVVPDPKGENFWDNSAKAIISGIIAMVLTHPTVKAEDRNLISVRVMLKRIGDEPVLALMRKNSRAGGLAAAAASMLDQAGENARGDMIATALGHTKWLDSRAMENVLEASDFSLAELKQQPTTIYLVLPPQYLDVHGRFLRLFINLSLRTVGQGRKQPHAVLFVLDEFYALGRMQLLAKAAGLLAGYGVKLWPIVQNLGQLEELYPDNWETFLGNAGMWQVFAVNDQTTARYLSERLGQHIVWRKTRTPEGGMEWTPQGASFLRTSVELARESSRDSGNQIIFVEGGDSFMLRRRPYDRTFKRAEYSPDPFEIERNGWREKLEDAGALVRRVMNA
jgi:type IV secretory pathway TraG/TraD family ATPase VirD4